MVHSTMFFEKFWAEQLADGDTAVFPLLPNPEYVPVASNIETRNVIIPKDGVNARLSTVIEAAWAITSALYIDAKNVTFGHRGSRYAGNAVPLQVAVDQHIQMGDFIRKFEDQIQKISRFEPADLETIRQISPATAAACRFQTEFSVQDRDYETVKVTTRPCALILDCIIRGNTLEVYARYDSRVLDSVFLNWMLRQFEIIIQRICNTPLQTVGQIATINEHDMSQILLWNKRVPPTVEGVVHNRIQKVAASQPDAPAVYAWDGQLTYGEIDTLSSKLGHHLRTLGVRPESFVPFCFEKSMWTAVVMLGIMKSGGVGVPLEPAHPQSRKLGMIEDVNATVIVSSTLQSTDCAALCSSGPYSRHLVVVNKTSLEELPEVPGPVCDDIRPSNSAYVIFTSGSTGKPKAVVWEHRGLASSIAEHGKALFFERKPRVLQFAAHVFDISVADTFTTLSYGGCICVPSDSDRVNGIAEFVQRSQANWAFWTPTFARLVSPADVPTLKTLLLGGEKVGQDNVEKWRHHVQLVLVYGPAETCIYCSGNEVSIGSTAAENIGKTFGGRLWITDSNDVNKLSPLGVPGEILVEGPILGREYLNDPEKTNNSFIYDPSWAMQSTGGRRFYRTGDLGRYTADGTIAIIGRKDNQVKVGGQRMELGEVEHNLVKSDLVNHAMALIPEKGPYQGRLTGVITLTDMTVSKKYLEVISATERDAVARHISKLREHLASKVPIYMIPTVWIPVYDIPLTLSRKLDRMTVKNWVFGLSNAEAENIRQLLVKKSQSLPTTDMEKKLQQIWAHVLNVAADSIGTDTSFVRLGGDSISAMKVTSRCRAEQMEVSVQDILRFKTIKQIALRARNLASKTIVAENEVDGPFDLSPIQKWHVRRVREAKDHFNQSFLLKLSRNVLPDELKVAIQTLLISHPLLRARFQKSKDNEQWLQYITDDIKGSYNLRVHHIASSKEVQDIIYQRQKSFSVASGPIFGADLINLESTSQLLFIAVHHAFIDLVSWRIILEDLEEILVSNEAASSIQKSLSFSTWLQMQQQYIQENVNIEQALPFTVPKADFSYWGMDGRPNLTRDKLKRTISIDRRLSELLLGSCNEALRTDPVDLLLSVVMHSFGEAFKDRNLPTIFNEGHGREPWNSSIDLSRTVGWFTVMSPISVEEGSRENALNLIKAVKDTRHSIPKNGWEYFTSRFLTAQGQSAFGEHDQMEILFNYFGLYQQLERKDGLMSQVPSGEFDLWDISPEFPEWALFEVEVGVEHGELQFHFSWNSLMEHQDKIIDWLSQCKASVEVVVQTLLNIEPEFTLSDFPMLSIDYSDLDTLKTIDIPQIERISPENIETIFPCAPMQEGILVAQSGEPSHYKVEDTFKISSKGSNNIDVGRLEAAWKQVVKHHPMLRTVFITNLSKNCLYQQVVLRTHDPKIFHLQASDHAQALAKLKNYSPIVYSSTEPGHRIGICSLENGDVYFRLEINHALIDATSTQIICKDLGLAYDGLLPDHSGPSYVDYISYTQRQLTGGSLNYWETYLDDVKASKFPNLNDGNIVATGVIKTVEIPFTSAEKVLTFCKEHGVTVANLISVVWGILLQTYTGEDDICFGYLASGRDFPIPDIQLTVGPFINMLVSRINLNRDRKVGDVIQDVMDDYIRASPHQVSSLAEISHALNLGGERLFNTAISLEKRWPDDLAEESSLLMKEIDLHDPTDFDLVLNVAYSDDQFRATITYTTSHLSDAQALNVADTLEKILISVLESNDKTINDIDRLGQKNATQLLAWNENLPGPVEKCVHEAIHEQALLYPDSVAISAWDGELTYRDLDDLSNRLSHYLSERGVGLEIVVPLAFEKCQWVIVTMLGVLKAGGACLTMDMTHPVSRLQGMIKQVGATLMLAAPDMRGRFEHTGVDIVTIDEDFIRSLPAQSKAACQTVTPQNMGFVVFTSGSTGNPKGIMLEHTTVCTSSRGHAAVFEVGPGSRCYQFSAFAFDVHISDIMTPLMYGAVCCVPSAKDIMDDLPGSITRLKATSTYITPTVATLFTPDDVPTLKKVALGGEPLTKANAKLWGDKVYLINVFGPSETSNWVSYRHVLPDTTQPANIGPGVDVNIWLVDAATNTQLVPIGCVGEMCIEGPILSRGYINDPEKTEAAFVINHPMLGKLGGASGRRFYATGDLVRANSDGSLLYVGRKDSQVKISGQRLELGEVEYALRDAPDVAQVSVVLPTSGLCKAQLVAVITLEGVSHDDSESLQILPTSYKAIVQSKLHNIMDRIAGRSKLAAWMVPRVWAIVNHIPKNASGKLDRSGIKQWVSNIDQKTLDHISTLTIEDELEMPSTPTEMILQELWSQVLNLPVEKIGIHSSFLRLGGDSLSIMRLVTKARSRGIVLSTATVFRHPKLGELAQMGTESEAFTEETQDLKPFALLGEDRREDLLNEISQKSHIARQLIQDIYPCTSLQQGIMALSIAQPGAYIAQNVYKLPAHLDLESFKTVWQTLYSVNPILRTRIFNTESLDIYQVVVDEQIKWQEATGLQDYLRNDSKSPMPLGSPLTRFAIVDGHFVMTAHHATYDGWSLAALLDDAALLYQNQNVDPRPPFSNFVKYVKELDLIAADAFWSSQLTEENTGIFPKVPHPKYQAKADEFLSQNVMIPRRPGSEITTSTILQAAWALVASRYLDHDNVAFGLLVSGRNATVSGIDQIMGPTITTVPVQVDIDPSLSVEEFLAQIQKQSTERMQFEQTGLQRIRSINAATNAACDFRTQLVIQPQMEERSGFEKLGIRRMNDEADDVLTYPLTFECTLTNTGVRMNTLFDAEVIDVVQMKRIMEQFHFAISQLTQELNTVFLKDLILTNPGDEKEIISWNSALPRSVEELVHDRISRWALSDPESQAICAWDGNLNYRELDTISSRLANYLQQVHQVGPNSYVPYCFEKSKFAIISVLAIMKAGGVSVPLEPQHPIDRMKGMVEDVGAKIILASPMNLERCSIVVDRVITIDDLLMEQISSYAHSYHPGVTPSHPVYVIFTSGSTGKPKGVLWKHSTLCSSTAKHGMALNFNSRPRVLQFASNVFDAGVAEIIDTMVHGGCICIPNDLDKTTKIVDYINNMQVSWLFLTPTFARLLRPEEIPNLRTLVLGGESIGADNIEIWKTKVQLINAYGPSECCILSSTHEFKAHSQNNSASIIGRPVGGLIWLTAKDDSDKLVPIGAVGEILVEGPTVAIGYLNNKEKTAESFIFNPQWSRRVLPGGYVEGQDRRFYKTGDLGLYNTDGTISFMGRKDNQIKLRGQRMELGEVEHHLIQSPSIQHAIVILPSTGPCKGQLTALTEMTKSKSNIGSSFEIAATEDFAADLAKIRSSLVEKLPSYMIPTHWLPVNSLPRNSSGKIDRYQVTQRVNSISQDALDSMDRLMGEQEIQQPATEMEKILQGVWSHVLNFPLANIGRNSSFYKLGGDSITAIQVAARSRQDMVEVTVPDILTYNTLSKLALRARFIDAPLANVEEKTDVPFQLSPIQQLYVKQFGLPGQSGSGHNDRYFNQSFLLQVNKHITEDRLKLAMDTIVKNHSMLRARFIQSSNGTWSQIVTSNIAGSYQLNFHNISDTKVLDAIIWKSQTSLDIYNGPVFGVDLISIGIDTQLLFITAHHLVVDLVSWRIILQDLEETLASNDNSSHKSSSFQAWVNSSQAEFSKALSSELALPFEVPQADYAYWQMEGKANLVQDLKEVVITIGENETAALLGPANAPLKTQPLELFLSSIIFAFAQTFQDRQVPTIFNEGHGREPWNRSLDLSQTVGWFTTLCPIVIGPTVDLIDSIRQVKDTRRKIRNNGFPYFTSRYLSLAGRQLFAHHESMEMTFNYSGQYQQFQREGALLSPATIAVDLHEQSPLLEQLGLFNIDAGLEQGYLKFSFRYSRHMKHQDLITKFINCTKLVLEDISHRLPVLEPQLTTTDFKQLSLESSHLDILVCEILPQLGVRGSDVEDLYPCSPIQEGILIAQLKEPDYYKTANIFRVHSGDHGALDVMRFEKAWQRVIKRHSILRTVFFSDFANDEVMYHQLVLKDYPGRVFNIHDNDERQGLQQLKEYPLLDYSDLRPAHRMGVFKASDSTIYCKFEFSHALIDAETSRLICREITLAYGGSLPATQGPLYSEYIGYIQSQSTSKALEYWKNHLEGVESCYLPGADVDLKKEKRTDLRSIDFSIPNNNRLQNFCVSHGVTVANIIQAAWALMLQSYVDNFSVCFGYLASGRDIPVEDISEMIGPLINMLICKVDITPSTSGLDIMRQIQEDYGNNLPYQSTSLARIEHELKLNGQRLFNTGLSVQKSNEEPDDANKIIFDQVDGYDPSDFDFVLNAAYSAQKLEATITYRSDMFSETHVRNIYDTFNQTLKSLLDSPKQRCQDIPRIGEHNQAQIFKWQDTTSHQLGESIHKRLELPAGSAIFITDKADYEKLVPIGATGELLVELSVVDGDFQDSQKVFRSLVSSPQWARATGNGENRRFFRTGHLGRYAPDGTIIYVGRADNKTKIHGRRIELEEVEESIRSEKAVKQVLAVAPRIGPSAGELVAVLILGSQSNETTAEHSVITVLSSETNVDARARISEIQNNLAQNLSPHMIPKVWIPVNNMPLTASGTPDRAIVTDWVSSMESAVLDEIKNLVREEAASEVMLTGTEARLQAIWADVLNLSLQRVTSESIFQRLGGDSVSALRVYSRCRAENIHITVPDMLRYETLSQIASRAKAIRPASVNLKNTEEEINVPFPLSPIQQMHIDSIEKSRSHFNQSFLLKLNNVVSVPQLQAAFKMITEHHSLLRAKFQLSNTDELRWTQFINPVPTVSIDIGVHTGVAHSHELEVIIKESQISINAQTGRVFHADIFNLDLNQTIDPTNSVRQLVFLTASHLVIDLVSWRIIIQDLEDILMSGTLAAPKSLSFQSWLAIQKDYINEQTKMGQSLPFEIPAANLTFWGMENRSNTAGDMIEKSIYIGKDETSLLLGNANETFSTEALDLLVSAVTYGFTSAFDRQTPAIYNEGHGRETWGDIDLSRTVGWFTTLCPIFVGSTTSDTLFDTIRKVKDTRSRIPQNGLQYFASRFMTTEGRKKHGSDYPEIVFNYAGQYQQLERADGLLSSISLDIDMNEQSPDLEVTGLINIGAIVERGILRLTFSYNRFLKHQGQIDNWISQVKSALVELAKTLPDTEKQLTLSDVPHLNLNYTTLDAMLQAVVSQTNASIADIENILPASSYQTDSFALTLSKTRGDLNYLIVEIQGRLDIAKLRKSFEALIKKHFMLRTSFVPYRRQLLQVVSKKAQIEISTHVGQQHTANNPSRYILEDMKNPILFGQSNIRLMVVEHGHDSHSLIIRIPHASFDSIGMSLMITEIQELYSGKPITSTAEYLEYFKYKSDHKEAAEKYWVKTLQGSSPTQFFSRTTPEYKQCGYKVVERTISPNSLQQNDIQMASVIKGAWALVLSQLSGLSDILFGDLANGRNIPIDGIENIASVCINMIPLRVKVDQALSVVEYLRAVQDQQTASMPFDHLNTKDIIEKCTNWPSWTTFGSTVNHTNYPFSLKPLNSGETTKWSVNQYTPGGNETDISIESHPNGQNLDISIIYGDKLFPTEYVSSLLEMLCSTVLLLSQNPKATISSLFQNSDQEPNIPISYSIGAIPRRASVNIVPTDTSVTLVQKVWEKVFWGPNMDYNNDTPFHVLWGHPIAGAQLSAEYKSEGVDISMDEILTAPSMNQQIEICARKMSASGVTNGSSYLSHGRRRSSVVHVEA